MNRWAIVIGLGLALVPIHNQWLTDAMSVGGRVVLFLPVLGYLLVLLGVALFVFRNWKQIKETGLGDRRVWIPLVVIAAAMAMSGFVNGITFQAKLSPLFMGVALFGVFMVARVLGESILRMLAPFVIIGSISVIVSGIISPGQYTGGFITNYCAAAGYLIFGVLVYQGRWRWLLLLIAAVGLFFIGALEAVFIVGILGIVLLVRRDFSEGFIVGISLMALLVIVWVALGYLQPLYEGNHNLAILYGLVTGQIPLDTNGISAVTSGRWEPIVEAVRSFSFIGHGYSLSTVGGGIVHNMPLIIMHQVGPFAALAWLLVSFFCLIKTGWKYIWVAVLAMGVFDHYLWTQMAPWWFALVGVTTASSLRSDLLFKRRGKVDGS